MSGLLITLPALDPSLSLTCLESVVDGRSSAGVSPDEVLVIDNSRDGVIEKIARTRSAYDDVSFYRDPDHHNLGVARSWNVGAQRVLDEGLDYLVLLSASMLFGPILHTTWRRQMEEFWGSKIIECQGHSWHLIAIHRTCFEKIGLFDSNFYPYAFESIDWCYRLRMVGWEQGFVHVWVNALSRGHAMHVEMVDCPARPLLDYYERKWGGSKGEEVWRMPYGTNPLDHFEDVSIPELARRYGLENWW